MFLLPRFYDSFILCQNNIQTIMASTISFITSNKGNPLLIRDNYIHYVSKKGLQLNIGDAKIAGVMPVFIQILKLNL